MTSEIEVLKTNEFQRRRKLRLQQVREQSKDIAKKIRQRAKVEQLKQVVDIDVKKQKEYLERQGELVKKLEDLYANGVRNIGTSHKNATETRLDKSPEKVDLSKLRGREAAAELKKKKQEKLDKQKQLLDRKLQAREVANELSREKSNAVAKKNLNKETDNNLVRTVNNLEDIETNKSEPVKSDMATQWIFEELPNEWEPDVPALSLPKDVKDSLKEANNNIETKSDSNKKIDLFAVSAEMPASLRGGLTNITSGRMPSKSSLTLVSEYLQSRGMGLRETVTSNKRHADDLQSIKQTILHTRSSKPEVLAKNNMAKVAVPDSGINKKSSVMIYNHSTRDARDVPTSEEPLVVRDDQSNEDAYSQAMRESTADTNKSNEHQRKIQDMRHKVAMTKHSIEKEYKDTINFLNALPKETNSRPIRNLYKDDTRQRIQKEKHQRKMQQEFKEIEKECKKHTCNKNRSKSKSPARDEDNDLNRRDFQYSWMPVPESDGNLVIHTIPTTHERGKPNHSVKFSKVDSYHEYRSQHKHTPPTKDTLTCEKQADRRVETVIIDNASVNSTDYSSVASDTSSVDNISLQNRNPKSTVKELSDAERIIIYKILDSKNKRKGKKKSKAVKEATKSCASLNKVKLAGGEHNTETDNRVQFEQLTEGVYKTVKENGVSYNVMNCYATTIELWQNSAGLKPWWDNITSMYFPNNQHNCDKVVLNPDEIKNGCLCCCNHSKSKDHQQNHDTNLRWETGDTNLRTPGMCAGHKCGCDGYSKVKESVRDPAIEPSATTSSIITTTSSFKTSTNDKASNALPDCGYIKLLDEGGQEAGKFYVGASGFLKDDAYEVVIQLRKKDGSDKLNEVKQTVSNEASVGVPVESVEKLKDSNNLATEVETGLRTCVKVDSVMLPNRESHVSTDAKNSVPPHKTESSEKITNLSKNFIDKGVHTSFELSSATPCNIPKTDALPKQATSTYTQTSITSPNHRPVYFQMSSSTSTAYMSPPEYVMPRFLRQDKYIDGHQQYAPTEDFRVSDENGISDDQPCVDSHDKCKCKRCVHEKNVVLTKSKRSVCCKKRATVRMTNVDSSPSTTRSFSTEQGIDNLDCKRKEENLVCCRFLSKPGSVYTNKPYNKRNKNVIKGDKISLKSCQNKDVCTYNYKPSNDIQTLGPNLKPSIKEYVNKLLSLNKEGIKVVEVADQPCSSVNTPSSSIINESNNIDKNNPTHSNMSLEQIKSMIKLQIVEEYIKKKQENINYAEFRKSNQHKNVPKMPRLSRRKPVHKVKSLNISKKMFKSKTAQCNPKRSAINVSSSMSTVKRNDAQPVNINSCKTTKVRSKSSPTPKYISEDYPDQKCSDNISNINKRRGRNNVYSSKNKMSQWKTNVSQNRDNFIFTNNRASSTSIATTTTDSENSIFSNAQKNNRPTTAPSQSSQNVSRQINYMKSAEDKLQNMEKIADLTEKCTKRLSNLARVLDEVRRNKSLAYSQISPSDSASDFDQKLDKNVQNIRSGNEIDNLIDNTSKTNDSKLPITVSVAQKENEHIPSSDTTDFVPFLTNIPKPNVLKTSDYNLRSSNSNSNLFIPVINIETCANKTRGKPPPAMSRIHLKNGQEQIVPHELSTVLEVDSPLSLKLKTTSSRDTKDDESDSNNSSSKANKNSNEPKKWTDHQKQSFVNPDLLQSNLGAQQSKISCTESSDDSKLQMMDLNQFNEIMLKPFMTFKEHAKRCNIIIHEGSNLEDNPMGTATDDISSLHSDGSLPDVVAELLKRNIISEPFKYDTPSNVNSTTISSESTLSVLALSKVRKKKHSGVTFPNKEGIAETSDSLSVSSNPDLENAFKKLGMGWASSTLKKTKERLALSSSSNTSSTSLSHYKLKSFNNQDIPPLVTDSISTILNLSKKIGQERNLSDSKNAEQQTSLTNSMTVKEFLNKELANKITFTNKSRRDDAEEEFVSLFETKMPENMRNISTLVQEECSADSGTSANNNRARTSTPVQVFKSTTYHSSSSSNSLFSNLDDLSSVKVTSNSKKHHSTSDKDDLTVPNLSLKLKKTLSDCSKND